MKANKKAILVGILAVLDCVFGGIVIWDITRNASQNQTITPKASGNYSIAVEVLDASLVDLEEIEEEKEEVEAIVYDNMTLSELAAKLERSLKDDLSGKGMLIASYSLEKGVDPYVATAIMLHETGCAGSKGCSTLVKACNNVGGQKGSGCGKGAYRAYPTLDDGIHGFIDNLAKNYYAKGLDTPEKMNKKYAESKSWSQKVNNYVQKIKSK